MKSNAATLLEKAHDAELVRRFKAGDEEAFAEIVARYRGKMFVIALSFLGNRGDAEEIAQDTFIRAYRGLATFRGDSSLATWLYHIAKNLSRNRYWYFFRRHRHDTCSLDCPLAPDSPSTLVDTVPSEGMDPSREEINREFITLATAGLEMLSPELRHILTLRNVHNEPYIGIARKLGISIGTVKSRIARSRQTLRRQLDQIYAPVT